MPKFTNVGGPRKKPRPRTTVPNSEHGAIYVLYHQNGLTQARIAELYKCSTSQIASILKQEKARRTYG